MQAMFYLAAIHWKENLEGDDSETNGGFLLGGSLPGLPFFSYGRSGGYSWGATALNPDNSDLYVEKIDGDKYLFDGQWH
jgi:acyl-homoserine lactone acylase PvdQ